MIWKFSVNKQVKNSDTTHILILPLCSMCAYWLVLTHLPVTAERPYQPEVHFGGDARGHKTYRRLYPLLCVMLSTKMTPFRMWYVHYNQSCITTLIFLSVVVPHIWFLADSPWVPSPLNWKLWQNGSLALGLYFRKLIMSMP